MYVNNFFIYLHSTVSNKTAFMHGQYEQTPHINRNKQVENSHYYSS